MNRIDPLEEAARLLSRPNLDKETNARINSLISLGEAQARRGTLAKHSRELGLGDYQISDEHETSFRAYLSAGKTAIVTGSVNKKYLSGHVSESIRAAQTTTTTAGGFITPPAFSDRVQQIISEHDPIYDLSQTLITSNGNATGLPLVDDSGVNAAIKAQNAVSDLADVTFGEAVLAAASTYRSGIVICPTELVSDSYFNLDNLLAQTFGFRLARQIGSDFTATMLTDAPVAVTTTSSTIAADEVLSLIGSLNSAYADGPSVGLMMRRATLTTLQQLKTTAGNYAFPAQRDSSGRMLLAGYPVFISPNMPAIGASNKCVAFGDFSQGFVKRVVANSLLVARFDERYAEISQVGFQGSLRVSGAVVKGGTVSPIVLLAMHS